MENSFSSSIIQVLKDNFVGKVIKVGKFSGKIVDVKLDDIEGSLEEEKLFFSICEGDSSVWTTFDLAALNRYGTTIESTLPARGKKDSIRYIAADYIGTDLKPGQQVLLISCQLDDSYMSGICCLVKSGDLKVNLCASLLVNYPFELM